MALNQDLETEKKPEEPQRELSDLEKKQTELAIDFTKKNYAKYVINDGKQIKIDDTFYNVTKINRAVEDRFTELETNLNKPMTDNNEARKALYDFLTFTTSITEARLDEADRGHLRSMAMLLAMMQKGFQ